MAKRSHNDFAEPKSTDGVIVKLPSIHGKHISLTREQEEQPSQRVKVDSSAEPAAEANVTSAKQDPAVLIQNLADALGALLDNEQTLLNDGHLHRIALARCRALQPELPAPKKIKPAKASKLTEAPTIKSNSEITPPASITPWTLASIPVNLPKLPKIKDERLERAAFTHSGVLTTGSTEESYERLEWVGDAYIYLLTTLLISKTFPNLGPGRSAQLRERCLKNETLAQYAQRYDFEKKYRVPKEFKDQPPVVKILGDVFEAYVAAVIYSDPEIGVERVSEWLKTLWAGTLKEEITEQMKLDAKTSSGPIITLANAKQELARQIMSRNIRLNYKDIGEPGKDAATGFPLYTVGVYLDGWGEKNKLLAKGTALGKKEAGAKAAEAALQSDLYEYKEKKRIFDEINKQKKEAEEREREASKPEREAYLKEKKEKKKAEKSGKKE